MKACLALRLEAITANVLDDPGHEDAGGHGDPGQQQEGVAAGDQRQHPGLGPRQHAVLEDVLHDEAQIGGDHDDCQQDQQPCA